jgi:predicted lipoprotein with Yx(FWY)xxD motif
MRVGHGRAGRGWRGVAAVAIVMSVGGLFFTSTASARPAGKSKMSKVVSEETRAGFGLILTTPKGRALYVDTDPPCTGSCLGVWPPLLMPKGKTVPTGAADLGTVAFGKKLQVTYEGKALYTFISDHGKSVTGNGVNGFAVAEVAPPAS